MHSTIHRSKARTAFLVAASIVLWGLVLISSAANFLVVDQTVCAPPQGFSMGLVPIPTGVSIPLMSVIVAILSVSASFLRPRYVMPIVLVGNGIVALLRMSWLAAFRIFDKRQYSANLWDDGDYAYRLTIISQFVLLYVCLGLYFAVRAKRRIMIDIAAGPPDLPQAHNTHGA